MLINSYISYMVESKNIMLTINVCSYISAKRLWKPYCCCKYHAYFNVDAHILKGACILMSNAEGVAEFDWQATHVPKFMFLLLAGNDFAT